MPPRTFRTGVTISQPGKAEGSYIIHDGGDVVSVLIDMAGNEINVWGHCGHPSRVIDPAINGGQRGHIFGQKEPNRFANEVVLELDWDSNPVWKWGANAPGGKARQHHDMSRLANGNILILSLPTGRWRILAVNPSTTMLFKRSTRRARWSGNGIRVIISPNCRSKVIIWRRSPMPR